MVHPVAGDTRPHPLVIYPHSHTHALIITCMCISVSLSLSLSPLSFPGLSDKEGYFNKSYDCLTKGTSLFQETQNIPNQALLHANLGSLMRTYASIVYSLMKNERRRQRGGEGGGGGEGGAGDEGGEKEGGDLGEFTPEERMYYNRSIDYYNKGKEILKRQSANPGIWLSIEMDLSNVYYEMGHKIQERPPLSSVEIQEVSNHLYIS